MPMIYREVSVPANTTVDNIITGSIYEYLPWNAAVGVGVNGSAAGLRLTVNSGSDTVVEEAPVNALNRQPVIPDDMWIQDRAMGGERLVVKVRNSTAGALTAFVLVQLEPI